MGAWRNTTSAPTATEHGVLRPDEFARHVELERWPASTDAERFVENHWALRWELPAGRTFVSQVLPHPTCSLTVELGSHPRAGLPPGLPAYVTGVTTARFDVDVAGWGRVVGVRFRPGGLAALTRRAASAWTDRVVPATDVLPRELCDVLADETLAASPREWASTAERALLQIAPEPDERYARLLDIVAAMLDDHTLLTVADVCERHGTSTRTLQRLFTHYVGIGPKWVLARYRMHDVVAAIDAGYDGTLTDLAVRFGFYDQAHFTREFTALIGVTPSEYRRARDER